MRIIKHGGSEIKTTCDKCNCLFAYSPIDIKIEMHNITLLEKQLINTINCPECGNKIIL